MYVFTRILAVLFLITYQLSSCYGSENRFPDYFKFGVATAAYQIEGGWNASGKGESIWDRATHEHPESVVDHSTGDVACDSYHLWRTDVQILKELGVQYHRFSLSWPRILPSGFPNHINQDGVKYYNDFINSLIANGIEPMVTLYHWDLPQKLQDLGGWTSIQTADYFAEYARVAFSLFGDRVKMWITINEPNSICESPYGANNGAPLIYSPGIGDYLCGKTLLMAHAKAYHVYDKEFREKQGGKIGITIDSNWAEPKTNNTEDIEAAEREMQMSFGWWAHPIFSKTGNYPEVMIKRIEARSILENYAESRLPALSRKEVALLKGSADFFGLNHYSTWLISNHNYPIGDPSSQQDRGTYSEQDPSWKPNKKTVPWGFYKLIKWVSNEYNNPIVYITENGYGDDGDIQDNDRIVYLKEFMKAVLQAVQEGCNVRSYTVWSVLDNMEWLSGYTIKFGLYHVDFDSPNRTRTPKASARFYKSVIKTRALPDDISQFLSN